MITDDNNTTDRNNRIGQKKVSTGSSSMSDFGYVTHAETQEISTSSSDENYIRSKPLRKRRRHNSFNDPCLITCTTHTYKTNSSL